MCKRIFNLNLIFAAIIFGTILSGCDKPPANTAQNSNENKSAGEGSAQAVNSVSTDANTAENNAASNLQSNAQTPQPLDKQQAQKTIEKYIAGVAKVSDADEYKEARKIIYGDLDGDGDEDAAAQFTIEGMGGGNNYGFYLAVFKNDNGKLTAVTDTAIGGKLNRDVSFTKIENGKMLFDTKDYDEDDGACCPSIEGKTAYVLEEDKLVEKKNK